MKQLLLDLAPVPVPRFDNFLAGQNRELLDALHAFAGGGAERFIYLWGETGCGKSHLLAATAAAARAAGRAPYLGPAAQWDGGSPVLADDVETLDDDAQVALFGLYNRLRDEGGWLLAAGNAPPAQLAIRPELATRLGWGLVFRVHALSDEEKAAALVSHAAQRGFALPAEIPVWLLRHWRRDLPSLLAAIDALDAYSLELKRPPSLPLLRDLMVEARKGL